MLGFRHSDALDTERLNKLGAEDCIVYSSFFVFHFDFTGGKGVGKSSLVRRFVVREFGEYSSGLNQSETLFFLLFLS